MRVRSSEIEKDRHRWFHRTAIHERVDILLTLLDKDIWVADHDFSLLGVNIGTRTTVVRLKGGGLFLHSPGPLDSSLSHEIDELGEVKYLVGDFVVGEMSIFELVGEIYSPIVSDREDSVGVHICRSATCRE